VNKKMKNCLEFRDKEWILNLSFVDMDFYEGEVDIKEKRKGFFF
jgi:hypothetical protein